MADAKKLAEELSSSKKTVFDVTDEKQNEEIFAYAEKYREFLDNAKSEREAVDTAVAILKDKGFTEYSFGDALEAGKNYYYSNRGKCLFAFHVGTENVTEGVRIAAAHIDSPRLDLKQHPLYEENGIGYLKTHYYGGIRKYQWTAIPLALHGTVVLADGIKKKVNIGDNAGDPVFCVSDLLPHLARKQGTEPLNTAIEAEKLNVIVASSPYMEDGKPADVDNAVKLNVLSYLYEKYGMKEDDFLSAELYAVPAGKCVDVGVDRFLLGAYGHDDTVCAYPALSALLDGMNSKHTVMCVFADKEETGSDGNTGMQSMALCDLVDAIAESFGANGKAVRAASKCLSADVTAAYDPNFADVYEKMNSTYLNGGVAMAKYTGSSGKYSTNDASAEFVGEIRRLFDANGVVWQTGELGKTDVGGGGTVAKYISRLNIDVVDVGVPVLSMHAPFELISKGDLYHTYLAFKAFFN